MARPNLSVTLDDPDVATLRGWSSLDSFAAVGKVMSRVTSFFRMIVVKASGHGTTCSLFASHFFFFVSLYAYLCNCVFIFSFYFHFEKLSL